MRYRVIHKTSYLGKQAVSIGHNKAWLEPRPVPNQQVESFQLKIQPEPSTLSRQEDYFGNPVSVFSFNEGYETLIVSATSFLDVQEHAVNGGGQNQAVKDGTTSENGIALHEWSAVREAIQQHQTNDDLGAMEFLFASPRIEWTEQIQKYASESFRPNTPLLEALRDLTERIHTDFTYDPRATTVSTPTEEVFKIRRGVCQDFAHLQIAMLRSMGLAARYVSGYLRTYPPEGQPRLVGADASHAWLSVYAGHGRWVDVDPTNNQFTSTDHITLAWGRDYSDVPPLAGVFIGGGQHRLSVEVDVLPLP